MDALKKLIEHGTFLVRMRVGGSMSLEVEPELRRLLSLSTKEVREFQTGWRRWFSGGDQKKLIQQARRAMQQGESQPVTVHFQKGRQDRWLKLCFHFSTEPQTGTALLHGTVVDVTAEKRQEQLLRSRDVLLAAVAQASSLLMASEDLHHGVLEALHILGKATQVDRIYVFENHTDPQTGELLTSQRYEWSRDSVEPQIDNPDLQNASYAALGMQRWREVLSKGGCVSGPVRDFPQSEQDLLKPQGIRSLLVVPIITRDGHFWGFIGFDDCHRERRWSAVEESVLKTVASSIGNTIDRLRIQDVIRQEKERLIVTLKSIGEGVIATDERGRVTLINPAAERLTGWSQTQAVGSAVSQVFHVVNESSRRPLSSHFYKRTLQRRQTLLHTQPHILVARDGREHTVTFSLSPFLMAPDRVVGAILVFRDVTHQKAMEAELLKANKLESLGILAGGIAHDFNNILASITGNVSLARLHVQDSDDAGELEQILADIELATRHARDLTLQLLTFAKGGEPVKKLADLGGLLHDSVGFILRGSRCRLRLQVARDLLPVEIDSGQFQQVLHNLALNAQQAMPQGGTLEVLADNTVLSAGHPSGLKPGPYVRICFRDEGHGIPPEHLSKIFDPYFTTKQQGSGLGLAICYSIVKRHGGFIGVESQLGKGTTFTILLPARKGATLHKPESRDKITAQWQGRVLVMDDEALIRTVLTKMLTRLGFEVTAVATAEETVRCFLEARDTGHPFDIVFLDLTVPGGKGGKEVLQELQAIEPGVRAVVSSGYSNDPILANYRRYGFCAAISKPYTLHELKETLHNLFS